MNLTDPIIALLSLILALLVAVMGAFAFVTSRIGKVDDSLHAAVTRFNELLNANVARVNEVMTAKIDALSERESKQRHDLRNELQQIASRQDQDISVAQRNVDEVLRDIVRRADVTALRAEMMHAIGDLKAESLRIIERTEDTHTRALDRLSERVEILTLRTARLSSSDDAPPR